MAARGATTGVAAEIACVALQSEKRVFHPRVADLFEALVVIRTTAHPIKVLRNDGVIGIGQRKPIDWLVPVVTRSRCDGKTELCSGATELLHVGQISNDDIGP